MAPLPLPFGPQVWPRNLRPAAHALWDFHRALYAPHVPAKADLKKYFNSESEKAHAVEPLCVVTASVTQAAYQACQTHRLPFSLLSSQIQAAACLATPARFESAEELLDFIQQFAGAHARLLQHLAGQGGAWREQAVNDFARALFLTSRLCLLQEDQGRQHVFIPVQELEQAGISIQELHSGIASDTMRRLLWKQVVRIRDAYASSHSLSTDLMGWSRRVFKRCWLGGLYLVAAIERRDYDVWSKPFVLRWPQRIELFLQILFGKNTFR